MAGYLEDIANSSHMAGLSQAGVAAPPGVESGEPRRARKIRTLHPLHAEPRGGDRIRDLAIQVVAAGTTTPKTVEVVLPAPHARIGRGTVFAEQQAATGPQDTTHLMKRGRGIRGRAQRVGHHDTVDALIRQAPDPLQGCRADALPIWKLRCAALPMPGWVPMAPVRKPIARATGRSRAG